MGNRNMCLLSNWQIALDLLAALSSINRFYARRKESNFIEQNLILHFLNFFLKKNRFPIYYSFHATHHDWCSSRRCQLLLSFISFSLFKLTERRKLSNFCMIDQTFVSLWAAKPISSSLTPQQFIFKTFHFALLFNWSLWGGQFFH